LAFTSRRKGRVRGCPHQTPSYAACEPLNEQGKSDEQKVRFYGVDMTNNQRARERLLALLQERTPALVADAERLFARVATAEDHWPRRVTMDADRQILKEAAALSAANVSIWGESCPQKDTVVRCRL
jgi:erythromycin esterase-like protein